MREKVGGLLFGGKDNSIAIDDRPSRSIGGEQAVRRSTITPIETKGGRLVYGPEIPCEIWDREREIHRSNKTVLRVYRKEFRVPEEHKGPLGRDWTLVIAHLPATHRRWAEARFQSRMVNRHHATYAEDLPSLARDGDVAGLSDEDLIRRLGELSENVFETGRYWVASLPYGLQRQGFFTPYGIGLVDGRHRERWTGSALRAGSATYAYGAYKGDFKSIWKTLWEDETFQSIVNLQHIQSPRMDDGRLVSQKIPLSTTVAEQITTELALATHQALAGWGLEAESHSGKPVAERIKLLCERAFEALHKRDLRNVARESQGVAGHWPADDAPEDVEDQLIDEIDRARSGSAP